MSGNTATEKQIGFINRLKAERQIAEDNAALVQGRRLWALGAFTKEAAGAVIDVLLAQPKPGVTSESTPEGMHRLGTEIYKVQRSIYGTGQPYAKRLILTEPDCGGCANGEPCGSECQWGVQFKYEPGAVRKLSEHTLMPLDEAKEFGHLYGICMVCGRTLTNEASISAGIGPVCAGRF